MKRLVVMGIFLLLCVATYSQVEVSKRDLEVRKVAPVLNLNGVGATVQFYSGDVSIIHSLNQLSVVGGRLAINNNLRVGASTLDINRIDMFDNKYALFNSNQDTVSPYIKEADRVDLRDVSVDGDTIYPNIFTGTSAPSVSAGKAGDIYINTSNGYIYISTASGNNWKRVDN